MMAALGGAPNRYPALDGMRGIAVVLVLAAHLQWPVLGVLGVEIFFVLSGFLITGLLLDEHAATGSVSLRRFYLRRTLRIFPAYYAMLGVMALTGWVGGGQLPPGQWWYALTYTLNYAYALDWQPASVLAFTWSLGIEEQFYLLWPGLVLLALRRGWPLGRILVAVLVITVVHRIWLVDHGTGWRYLYNALDTRADLLAAGCLLAVLWRGDWLPRALERLRAPWWPLLPAAFIAADTWRMGDAYAVEPLSLQRAVAIAVLLALCMRLSPVSWWRWLDLPAVRFIGTLSYSLYLWHIWAEVIANSAGGPFAVRALITLVLTFVMALVSFHLVERPALRLRDRLAGARTGRLASRPQLPATMP
jgi:peptidoglycan/LPS O-acetylase OafA/YrhL